MQKCSACLKNKKETELTLFPTGSYDICPSCKEEIKWTRTCLGYGTLKVKQGVDWVGEVDNPHYNASKTSGNGSRLNDGHLDALGYG